MNKFTLIAYPGTEDEFRYPSSKYACHFDTEHNVTIYDSDEYQFHALAEYQPDEYIIDTRTKNDFSIYEYEQQWHDFPQYYYEAKKKWPFLPTKTVDLDDRWRNRTRQENAMWVIEIMNKILNRKNDCI